MPPTQNNTHSITKQHYTHTGQCRVHSTNHLKFMVHFTNHLKDMVHSQGYATSGLGGRNNFCPGQDCTSIVQSKGSQIRQDLGDAACSRGDGMKCLQWNVYRTNSKLATLQATSQHENIDILLLWETLINNPKFNFSGYTVYTISQLNGRGLTTLIKKETYPPKN